MGDDDMGEVPTELAPSAEPTEAVTAWSLADDEDWPPPRLTPGRITALAVAGALVLLAAAGVLAAWHLRPAAVVTTAPPSTQAAPTPAPPPTSVVIATSTVAQPAPPPVVAAPPVDYRAILVGRLRAQGWSVWNPADMAEAAEYVCRSFLQGVPRQQIVMNLAVANNDTIATADEFVATVSDVYPDCP